MKQETLIRLDKILNKVDDGNVFVVTAIVTIIIYPFIAIYQIWKYVVRKVKGKVYDPKSQEWITKEEQETCYKILDHQKSEISSSECSMISQKFIEKAVFYS